MSKGPEQLRYEQAVEPGDAGALRTAALEWYNAAGMLREAADKLRAKAASAGTISEHTGPKMGTAFTRSAKAMTVKAEKLEHGSKALMAAAETLQAAVDDRPKLKPLHDPGTYVEPGDAKTPEEVKARAEYDSAVATYERNRRFNEELSRQHNQQMDAQNRESTRVMKSIHGEPDQVPEAAGPGGGSGGSGGTAYAGGSSGAGTIRGAGVPAGASTSGPVTIGTGTGEGAGVDHHVGPAGPVEAPAASSGQIGTPQGGVTTGVTPGAAGVAGASPAAAGSTAGANVGGVAAVMGGGLMAGAGGVLGGIRGGAAPVAAPGGRAAAGAAPRAIGATGRTAAAGTLGRGTAAATGSSGRATNSGSGRAAPRGTARVTAGVGSAGGRGSAGRAATVATGSGRGGKGRRTDLTTQVDHLHSEQDWVDDEDAAPPTLD